MEPLPPEEIHDPIIEPIEPVPTPELSRQKRPLSPWISIPVALTLLAMTVGIAFYLVNAVQTRSSIAEVTPTPTPTAVPARNQETNWNIYTNSEYHYSIEYPDDWSIREFPDSGTGAAFNPKTKPGYPDDTDSVVIKAQQRIANFYDTPFEEYVKQAASSEIEGFGDLKTIKKIETNEGVVGYETTWEMMSRSGEKADSFISTPITYFELPGKKAWSVIADLNRQEDYETYEKMLKTITFTTLQGASPAPVVDEKSVIMSVIKKYIALKHSIDEESLSIIVSSIDGDFAEGSVSDGNDGGGYWFAAKEDGLWKLVTDGNGYIPCSAIALYPDFPSSMIPECFDETTQDLVKR